MRPIFLNLLYSWIKNWMVKYLKSTYLFSASCNKSAVCFFVHAAIYLHRFSYYLNESFLIWLRKYQSIKHRSNFQVSYLCLVIRAINNPATKQFSLRRVRLTVNDIHKNSFPFEKKILLQENGLISG